MTAAQYIGSLIIALVGAFVAFTLGRKSKPAAKPTTPAPPPPEKTAHEHTNDKSGGKAHAITEASKATGVDTGTVAGDLDWYLNGDGPNVLD